MMRRILSGLLLSNLIYTAYAIEIRASSGTFSGSTGALECDVAKHGQLWGCLPGKAPDGRGNFCDATLSIHAPFSDNCFDPGTSKCRGFRAGYMGFHVMYSGNNFNCLQIAGSGKETVKVYSDGKCKNLVGDPILAEDWNYIFQDKHGHPLTAHCIEIIPPPNPADVDIPYLDPNA